MHKTERRADTAPWAIFELATGRWAGSETMPPAPWAPDGLQATGRMTAETAFDGRGLVSRYEQEVDGAITMRTHTVLRYDEEAGRFTMHFFNGAGGDPTVLEGRREGDMLVFEGQGPMGPMRQSFDYGSEALHVRSRAPDPEGGSGEWITLFEGRYLREPDTESAPVGKAVWRDLTVPDAPALRDFYAAVVGWEPADVSMGDYADYNMLASDGTPAAGVCHARGVNANLPPVWLVYVPVADLDAALAEAGRRGGEVVAPPLSHGGWRRAVIRDPAGAVLALGEETEQAEPGA